ncbi:hypothetical protein SAMN04487930_10269 [Cytophaga hutchinsonii ATCC 33406]|nr:hypothetical protein SAMN04487930_10269 [Cytophaga hutchinsonii ATCC 33406]
MSVKIKRDDILKTSSLSQKYSIKNNKNIFSKSINTNMYLLFKKTTIYFK